MQRGPADGVEYKIELRAVRLEATGAFGGVLVVRRLPDCSELYRDETLERGCCYGSASEALRHGLLEGQRFIRADQLRMPQP
jgi:hypothetical protein